MNKSKVSYMTVSDIHFGHSRTPTKHIIQSLDITVKKNINVIKKLDIIFLAGDIWDKLLNPGSAEYIDANEYLSLLVLLCVKHHIKLRALLGTPSHDWKQMAAFSKIINTLGVDVDYKYIDTLSIEHMKDLDITILYVPDEWNHDAKDTLVEVKGMLNKYELEKVDIAIMHGQFTHQIPMVELPSSHNEEAYLDIVKYYINIGHIHKASVYGRILAQGSFDRLAHGEEEDKGFMIMNIYHTGDMDFKFIKNKNAYPYRKFDLSDLDTKEVIKFLNKELPKLKLATRVKVVVVDNEVNKLLRPIQERFKDLIFDISKKKVKTVVEVRDNKVVVVPFEIHRDNIEELLLKELDKHDLGSDDRKIIQDEIRLLL